MKSFDEDSEWYYILKFCKTILLTVFGVFFFLIAVLINSALSNK